MAVDLIAEADCGRLTGLFGVAGSFLGVVGRGDLAGASVGAGAEVEGLELRGVAAFADLGRSGFTSQDLSLEGGLGTVPPSDDVGEMGAFKTKITTN